MGSFPKIGVGVGVVLLKEGKVLLGLRHPDSQKAKNDLHGEGTWTLPGGKVEFKENLRDTAFREVFEETGIKIQKESLEIVSISDDILGDVHYVTIGFLAKDFEGKPQVKEPEKIIKWNWFFFENLPTPLFFPSARIIKNFLKKKIY